MLHHTISEFDSLPRPRHNPRLARSHIQADCDLNCTLWRSRRRMTFPEEFYDDLESCRFFCFLHGNKTFAEKTTNSTWTDPKRGGRKMNMKHWNSTYHSIYEYPKAAGDIRRSFVPRLQLEGKKSSLLKCEDILWNLWPFLLQPIKSSCSFSPKATKNKATGWLAAMELPSTSKTLMNAFTLGFKKRCFWVYILCGSFCNFLKQVWCVWILLKDTYIWNTISHWQHIQGSTCWNAGKNTSFRPSHFFHIQSCQSTLAKLCPRSLTCVQAQRT